MFKKWLAENKVSDFDFSGIIYEKAANREFWGPKFKKEYIEQAEQYLGYEWPLIRAADYIAFDKEGDRKKQETPHFNKRTALIALFLGEVLEYKGRFIPDIVDGVFNICEESFWGLSAHTYQAKLPLGEHYIDLFVGETGSLISIILYVLRDELYNYWPEIIGQMEYNLAERVVKPYIKYNDFWWMNCSNNWNPWVHSNILTVFLLTQQNRDFFHKGIEKMFCEINSFYDVYSDDGGCDEGTSYWVHSGGALFDFCDQLHRSTNGKINFFNDDKIKAIGDYAYKAYIGNNYFVNFADGNCKGDPLWKPIFKSFGEQTDNLNLIGLSKENFGIQGNNPQAISNSSVKESLATVITNTTINNENNLKLCENELLPILHNAFAREKKWYYAAKGGSNAENHNHNDVGSFMVFYDCNPVLVDPGCGVYTKQTFSEDRYKIWTMQSGWHNIPLINGVEQPCGAEYYCDNFSFENKKCRISFKDAYEKEAKLKELIREISISDNGVEITDSFTFDSENNTISEHFITPLSVEIKENAIIIGGKYILSANTYCEISTDKQVISGDEKLTLAWNADFMNRIILKMTAGNEKAVTLTLTNI